MTVQDLLRHTAGLPYGELTAERGRQGGAGQGRALQARRHRLRRPRPDARRAGRAAGQDSAASTSPGRPGSTALPPTCSDASWKPPPASGSATSWASACSSRSKMTDTAFWVPEAKIGRRRRALRQGSARGHADQADRGLEAARQRLRRRRRRVDRGRLSALRADAGERRRARRRAHPEPHHRQAHDLRSPGLALAAGGDTRRRRCWAPRPTPSASASPCARRTASPPVPGSAGDFNWGGYAGTVFWVDPKEQLVAVFMVQSAGALRSYHRNLFRQLVYQAIAD